LHHQKGRSTQAVRKHAFESRLYESLPQRIAIVGRLHDFSHYGGVRPLTKGCCTKTTEHFIFLLAVFHDFPFCLAFVLGVTIEKTKGFFVFR
jgi:hypothetical protein